MQIIGNPVKAGPIVYNLFPEVSSELFLVNSELRFDFFKSLQKILHLHSQLSFVNDKFL